MLKRMSIQNRLALFLLAIGLAPTVALFVFTFRNNLAFYREQVVDATGAAMDRTALRIDHVFDGVEQVMDTILYNQIGWENDVQSICRQEYGGGDLPAYRRLENSRIFEYTSRQTAYNNPYIESVCLYTNSAYNYSYNKSYQSELSAEELARQWQRFQSLDTPYLSVTLHRQAGAVYYLCSKSVVHTDTGKSIGMLTLVCNQKMFEELTESLGPWSTGWIVDSDGGVVYADDGAAHLTPEELSAIATGKNGAILTGDISGSLFFRSLDRVGWTVVSRITMDAFYDLYIGNILLLVAVGGGCVAGALLVSVIFSRTFTRPIVQLSKTMETAVPQGLSLNPAYVEREDEIGTLYRRFGFMVDKINILIEEQYLREIDLLGSKMKNLVAQINSHFVFNTLETINAVAEIEEIESIAVMSKSLGDMLRYSIDYETDVVCLSDELGHIREYLSIQEVRFGRPIALETDVGDFADHPVLKFMLQPVVENAVEHGFHSQTGHWRIRIRAAERNGCLELTLWDNGVGVSPQRLCQIRNRLQSGDSAPSQEGGHFSIGLINIHKRIQLLYSREYGLDIAAPEEGGTAVTIRLPHTPHKEAS